MVALNTNGWVQPQQQASWVAGHIIQIVKAHIRKENMILFPVAQQALTPEEIAEVSHKWKSISLNKG